MLLLLFNVILDGVCGAHRLDLALFCVCNFVMGSGLEKN